jgi:hypothetical protein
MNTVSDRQWLFHLAYCEAGFSTGRCTVVQMTLPACQSLLYISFSHLFAEKVARRVGWVAGG